MQKTNLGGWQSDVDLFEHAEPEIALLRTRSTVKAHQLNPLSPAPNDSQPIKVWRHC